MELMRLLVNLAVSAVIELPAVKDSSKKRAFFIWNDLLDLISLNFPEHYD
jgi:hypothetical protein